MVSALSASENPKTAKLKKDLEIVKSNINLTNEIIDSSNPSEDVSRNDILSDMMKTLKGVEDKLSNLITNMSGNDETMMSYCLELNDDLMKVHNSIINCRLFNAMMPLRNTINLFHLRLKHLNLHHNNHNNRLNGRYSNNPPNPYNPFKWLQLYSRNQYLLNR